MKKNIQKWIDKNIDKNKLINKTILITGGNSGIGFEVAKICAYLKMNIILAIRDIFKGKNAKNMILKLYPKTNISLINVELSSKKSIEKFADYIKENKIDIDVFYHNAGVYNIPHAYSQDGYELVMATNAISSYLLINELFPYFKNLNHEVKFILTTSIIAKKGRINYSDLFLEKKYNKWKIYSSSKLINVHLYLYLKEHLKDSNIIPLLVHPGITASPLIKKAYPKWFSPYALLFMKIFFHKVDKSALSTIALLSDKYSKFGFVGPRGIYNISGYPKRNVISKRMEKDYQKTVMTLENILKTPLL